MRYTIHVAIHLSPLQHNTSDCVNGGVLITESTGLQAYVSFRLREILTERSRLKYLLPFVLVYNPTFSIEKDGQRFVIDTSTIPSSRVEGNYRFRITTVKLEQAQKFVMAKHKEAPVPSVIHYAEVRKISLTIAQNGIGNPGRQKFTLFLLAKRGLRGP
ncbi:hypothetical protein NM688_g1394 [Phlebia brevispora]|uniref:Uncharacterized protein n=1 Tax=Phlebia brevispora TaxID=194682 RepID=A0ACC1TBY4_9APHY|nr:hypothetical protein NM688_g1394 [Phlebia brevispora]